MVPFLPIPPEATQGTQPRWSLLSSKAVSQQPPCLPAHDKHTITRVISPWASDIVNTWTALSL